jgi:vacuolar-type H+-ATPase subunit E/Vma4
MALDELLRSLEEESDARVEALLAQARGQADELRANRAKESAGRRDAALAAREAELRGATARDLDAARREARRRVLQARADALQRIRRRAEDLLTERTADPAFLPSQAGDLERALAYLDGGAVLVEAPLPLVPGLQVLLDGRVRVLPQPGGAARPGLAVRAEGGGVTVDVTPGGRLARAWPRLSIDLAARLEAMR